MALKISEEARVQMPMKNGSLPDRAGRNWDLGFFWYTRKIKSTLNSIKNDGEGLGTLILSSELSGLGDFWGVFQPIPSNLC